MCTISYKYEPDQLMYDFIEEYKEPEIDSVQIKIIKEMELVQKVKDDILFKERSLAVNLIKKKNRSIKTVGVVKSGIVLSLSNVSNSENYIYYKLIINNTSNLNYELDFVSIYSEEKVKKLLSAKNKKVTNINLVETIGSSTTNSKGVSELVIVTDKYSINERGKLVIQLYEKNGSRHLSLVIPADYILNF